MKSETRLRCSTIIAPLLFLFGGATASAQYADGLDTDQPLFATHDILKVRIEAPLSTLVRDRSKEKYLDGMFYYIDAQAHVTWMV